MCVLRISGKNFDPDALPEGSTLEPYDVYRRGEPRWRPKPDGSTWDRSGFGVTVSDASWHDLRRQVADACTFLDRHGDELRRLLALGTIDDMRLDFPVYLRIGVRSITQYEFFPPELVEKAGALRMGLELSIYPPADDDDEPAEGESAGQGPAVE